MGENLFQTSWMIYMRAWHNPWDYLPPCTTTKWRCGSQTQAPVWDCMSPQIWSKLAKSILGRMHYDNCLYNQCSPVKDYWQKNLFWDSLWTKAQVWTYESFWVSCLLSEYRHKGKQVWMEGETWCVFKLPIREKIVESRDMRFVENTFTYRNLNPINRQENKTLWFPTFVLWGNWWGHNIPNWWNQPKRFR